MTRFLFALTLLLATVARAAPYAPASTALIDWTPNVSSGVGVPGGIPARSTIAATITTTGDSTDRSTEILAAVAAASAGETVKLGLGTFYVSGLGFTPTTGSATYSTAIAVSVGTTVIKAIAVKSGMTNSSEGSATYTITAPATYAPTRNAGAVMNLLF